QDARLYEEWKWFRCPTLAEVLAEFPSLRLPPALLLTQLPLLQPRYYSVSSAPAPEPPEIHLTVAVVAYRTQSEGTGTGDMGTTAASCPDTRSVAPAPRVTVLHSTGVSPGAPDPLQPCPAGGPLGPMVLVFGCRAPALDHIYRREMEEALEGGALSQVLTAFSREPGTPK
ncbi:NOS3 protein, partial [Syrrhaptes paradoxus]|nr:NOS3 protein [Syrrhaptes paradoxus]